MNYAEDDDEFEEPPFLKRLRILVMVLIVVLIVGFIAIASTLVIRLGFLGGRAEPIKAEALALPAGSEITGLGRASGAVLVTVRSADGRERLLNFDAGSGALVSETDIMRD
ncbi:MAG: DUF6476 family protein [Pseudomonadota bacterium]